MSERTLEGQELAPEIRERFWAKVAKSEEGCWLWIGPRMKKDGRGLFWTGKQQLLAPRYIWWISHGPIPPGMFVCHTCDNPSCVNVSHLWLGTNKDNLQDAARKGRVFMGGKGVPSHLKPRGEQHGQARLTAAQVMDIRERRRQGERTVLLAAEFGVAAGHIRSIARRQAWSSI